MGMTAEDREAAAAVIEQVLEAAVVNASGIKIGPASSEELALNIVEALDQAGFALSH